MAFDRQKRSFSQELVELIGIDDATDVMGEVLAEGLLELSPQDRERILEKVTAKLASSKTHTPPGASAEPGPRR